jgi:hypothetical protein
MVDAGFKPWLSTLKLALSPIPKLMWVCREVVQVATINLCFHLALLRAASQQEGPNSFLGSLFLNLIEHTCLFLLPQGPCKKSVLTI